MMVRLSIEVYNKLTDISKSLNMPRSQVINMLVSEWMMKNK